MEEVQFWNLIAQSRQEAPDCHGQAERLYRLLVKLTPEEIRDFDRHFARRRFEAYRWDLWAVAYIINGGCSEDGFEYFRCWLIGQGQQAFEAALASPSSVSELTAEGEPEAECESLLYVANEAYEQVTGHEMPATEIVHPKEPAGDQWSEEDLP